jgi:outer membrane protein assembly factor BamB
MFAASWPQFRGPNGNGIATDRLNKQWTGAVTNPLWRIVLTNGLGSLAVADGRVFTLARRRVSGQDVEVCVALNATNGAQMWSTVIGAAGYPDGGVGYDDGPRSTPAVHDGSVFVISSQIRVLRLNATNGSVVWSNNMVTAFGSALIPWQSAASPVIESNLLFMNINVPSLSLLALRISDGTVAWRSQNDYSTHATPALVTIHGVRQAVFATQTGLVSVNTTNGALLWRTNYALPFQTSLGTSPVVDQDMVFISGAHSYGMGSMAVRVGLSNGTWSVTPLWATNNPAAHWMTPLARNGFLYGHFGIQSFDSVNAQFKCVDLRSGAVKWTVNSFGRCSPMLVDDHIVTLTERGALVLIRPDTNALVELARFTAVPGYLDSTNKCWNMPVVADGRVYVRSTAYVAAFDLSVPALKLDLPVLTTSNQVQLTIRSTTGAPVVSNQFTNIEVRVTTNLSLAVTQWTKLTNPVVFTGGVARITAGGVATNTPRYFIVNEPK